MASLTWAIGTPTMTRLAARSRIGQAATSDRFTQAAGADVVATVVDEVGDGVTDAAALDAVAPVAAARPERPVMAPATRARADRDRVIPPG